MDIQTSIEQVAGILHRAELEFQTHSDGDSYRLLFEEDAVFVNFDAYGDGVRIWLTSPVLQELDPEDAGYAVLLNELNRLNLEHRFAKFVMDGETLLAVHDLLGDDLQSGELLNAVFSLAAAARGTAERFADATGGRRYADVLELELEEVEDD